MDLSGKAVIIGYGQARSEQLPGKTSLAFVAEAAKAAIEDAGIDKNEIDGLFTAPTFIEPYPFYGGVVAEYLGLRPNIQSSMSNGGSTHSQVLLQAALAVATGLCKTALVVIGDNRSSGISRSAGISNNASLGAHPDFELPFGPSVPSLYALAATRHMFEFGTTSEQLAQVAVSHRRHAVHNDLALMREPISIADVLASKPIADPLRLLDCCLFSDFGGALIVTSSERGRDAKNRPVSVLGLGEGTDYEYISQAQDISSSAAIRSGKAAFSMAGLRPADMQFAQLYDCFTITVLITLEDLGFCAKGEAGAFVEGGQRIEIGGQLPINTHGGLLSCSNGGILGMIEAVRQLRHEAGARQIPNANVGLVHSQGGILSSHCTVILGNV